MKQYNVFVIGVGGTGSFFAKELVRFLSSCNHDEQKTSVTLIDGDVVEGKNLSRQSYQKEDIGRNKAEALAEALTDVFGYTVRNYPYYITEFNQMANLVTSETGIPVIVGCVDNHRARQVLHDLFSDKLLECYQDAWRQPKELYYFDAANELSSGEVVFSSAEVRNRKFKVTSPLRSTYFPEVLSDRSPDRTEISCEELNNVSPQHIATNMLAANHLLTATTGLLMTGVAPKGIVYFDISTFGSVLRNAEGGYCYGK